MNKNTIYISLLLVGGIFLYWYKNRPKVSGKCAELWKSMSNPNAQTFYFEAMNLAENDPDTRSLIDELHAAQVGKSRIQVECQWSVDYAYNKGSIGGGNGVVMTLGEKQAIEDCMCQG